MAKLEALARHVEEVEARFGVRLDTVSGGNSANLPLMEAARMPARINQLRIGAAILRGENSITGDTLPWLRGDAFTLEAELVEIKTKHSLPEGETGRDAFGNVLTFVDRGERVRGIVNLGRVDIRPEGLTARDADVEMTTASSDHLIVDLTGARRFAVGDAIGFDMDYGALVQAFLSPYVEKHLAGRETVAPRAAPAAADRARGAGDAPRDGGVPGRGRRGRPRDGGRAARPSPATCRSGSAPSATRPGSTSPPASATRTELGLLWLDSELGPAAAAEPEVAGAGRPAHRDAGRIRADPPPRGAGR